MTWELIWILLAALLGSAAGLLLIGIGLINKRLIPLINRLGLAAVALAVFLGFVAIVVLIGSQIFEI